jgi:hypothetical protein
MEFQSNDETLFLESGQYVAEWARCWRYAGALLLLVTVSGCATYRPMPITEEGVRAGLQPPDTVQVRALAREIKHPILHFFSAPC